MSSPKEFEKNAIRLLATNVIPSSQIEELLETAKVVGLEFTGHGYFLTMRLSGLSIQRVSLSKPKVQGESGELLTGFVAFIENEELTLECFSYGEESVPEDYRELDIDVF